MSNKTKQILFYIIGLIGLIKIILMIATGGFFGLVSYSVWFTWLVFVLFVVFMYFFWGFAFKKMYSLNYMIIALVIFALIVLIIGLPTKAMKFGKSSSEDSSDGSNATSSSSSATGKLTDNFIRCDVDSVKGVEFTAYAPSFAPPRPGENTSVDPTTGATILMGFGKNGSSIEPNFPGQKTGTFAPTADGKYFYGISYGLGTAEESYSTKTENGDTYKIKVTKYDGNIIEGTFSGDVTKLTDNSKRVHFKNCSFKSNLPITTQ